MERSSSGGGGNERGERPRGQRFQFGPWLFNVDQAQALIAGKPRESVVASVPSMAHFYGLDAIGGEGRASVFTPTLLDRDYAMTTDLEEPVIIAQLRTASGESFQLLIDGVHRLYRAYTERMEELPAYLLSIEESLSIREDPFAGSPLYTSARDGARHFTTDAPDQRRGEE
jgi:hypothetical protein